MFEVVHQKCIRIFHFLKKYLEEVPEKSQTLARFEICAFNSFAKVLTKSKVTNLYQLIKPHNNKSKLCFYIAHS